MLANQAQRALEAAAIDTLSRIRQDQSQVNFRLRPLLEHIEANLFDPGLDVNQLKRSCGVRDNSVPIQFHAQLGKPPHAYIEECRLRTGCRLLKGTDLKIWQIADLLGYSSIQVFSRAFTRWAGERPTTYRKQSRRAADQAAPPNGASPRVVGGSGDSFSFGLDTLKRALDGELEATEADRLIRRLLNLYPANALLMADGRATAPFETEVVDMSGAFGRDKAGEATSVRGVLAVEDVERFRAEAIWDSICQLSHEEQQRTIQQGPRFKTPAFFELLREKSRTEGRSRRNRGAEIAHLAVESLELINSNELSQPELANLRCRAWTTLGNAMRLDLDFLGAAKAFGLAQGYVGEGMATEATEGELLQNRAALKWNQRELDGALDMSNQAVDKLRNGSEVVGLVRALLLRGHVYRYSSRDTEAVCDYNEVLGLLGVQQEPYLRLVAYQSMADMLVRSGKPEEAEAFLPHLKKEACELPGKIIPLYVRWLEGLLAQDTEISLAEKKIRGAREGLIEIEDYAAAAMASLDLALLLSTQQRAQEVAEIAAQILPHFEARKLGGEMLLTLGVLRKSIDAGKVQEAVLRRMRSSLARDY